MNTYLANAAEELKRADHLFFVSLKYTRSVDVIKNVAQRLVNAMEFLIDALLGYAKEKKKIKEIPANKGLKCNLAKEIYDDEVTTDFINFYVFLRKLLRAEYKKSSEFRRHVTMSVLMDGGLINVDIDCLREYYEKTKAFLSYVEGVIGVKEE